MQTGNRTYRNIERKRKCRRARRANKGPISKGRRRSAKDRLRSLWGKGLA